MFGIVRRDTLSRFIRLGRTYLWVMEEKTEVLYNAECPVCSFEIGHYKTYAEKNALPLRFDDLNSDDLDRWGLTPDQAARRLYVRKGEQLLSGIPAFIVLWNDMPRYRWLARLVGLPGIHWLANLLYDHVLAAAIYKWHLNRTARMETEC